MKLAGGAVDTLRRMLAQLARSTCTIVFALAAVVATNAMVEWGLRGLTILACGPAYSSARRDCGDEVLLHLISMPLMAVLDVAVSALVVEILLRLERLKWLGVDHYQWHVSRCFTFALALPVLVAATEILARLSVPPWPALAAPVFGGAGIFVGTVAGMAVDAYRLIRDENTRGRSGG